MPDDLSRLLSLIEHRVPAGVGAGHSEAQTDVVEPVDCRQARSGRRSGPRSVHQFGTLGSGNHFLELCLDEDERRLDRAPLGSRGIGKTLAERHIAEARSVMARYFIELEDRDLAYVVEGTTEFECLRRRHVLGAAIRGGEPGQDDERRHDVVSSR